MIPAAAAVARLCSDDLFTGVAVIHATELWVDCERLEHYLAAAAADDAANAAAAAADAASAAAAAADDDDDHHHHHKRTD